ncbi:ribosome recycling factor [bacterium]|nr:ribosome recycling factor [bacterium]
MKIEEYNNKLTQTFNHFKEELSQIRTGSANNSLVENIMVTAYEGSPPMRVLELATINVVDPYLLAVSPYDKSITEKISKAIKESSAGLNPSVDGSIIKVPVPQLNAEQRQKFVKFAKDKLEEARIAVRNIRQDAIKSVEEREENGVTSEDEMKREKTQIEEGVKNINKQLEDLFDSKEKELTTL